MSNFVIDFTDPLSPGFSIAAGAYNGPGGTQSSTTLRLYGQGARQWGESVNEDLVKLLENFMGASEPVNPVNGQLWLQTFLYYHDTLHSKFYAYDLTQRTWVEVVVTSAATQPSGYVGQYWFNTNTSVLSMFYSAYQQQAATWHVRAMATGADFPTGKYPLQQARVYDVSVQNWVMMPVVNITTDTAAPANNAQGTFRYNPTAKVLYVWDGSGWDALSTASSPVFTGVVDANSFKVINVGDATTGTDAVNLQTADAKYLAKTGGALTGALALSGAPTLPAHAATKAYVDAAAASSASTVATFPIGGIIMWSNFAGSIPTGWHLCDGTGGTPDLRDRFVVAAGTTHNPGDTGGSANSIAVSHTHLLTGTAESSGAHMHTGTTSIASDHTHGYNRSTTSVTTYDGTGPNTVTGGALSADATDPAGEHSHIMYVDVGGVHTHTVSGITAAAGSDGANANLPPYYALAFIMKVA